VVVAAGSIPPVRRKVGAESRERPPSRSGAPRRAREHVGKLAAREAAVREDAGAALEGWPGREPTLASRADGDKAARSSVRIDMCEPGGDGTPAAC
jgi:hypothetical protein